MLVLDAPSVSRGGVDAFLPYLPLVAAKPSGFSHVIPLASVALLVGALTQAAQYSWAGSLNRLLPVT